MTEVLPAPRVREAAAAWIWVPVGASRAETDELLVVRYPEWYENPLQLVRFHPRRPLAAVLDDARRRAAELSASELCCWVRLDAPDGLERELVSLGGRLDETLDVLARPLAGLPDLAPDRSVRLRWTDDLDVLADAVAVGAEVFGGTVPDRSALQAEFDAEAAKVRAGGGGAVVAYDDGRPVGTAGVSVVGPDARLWGGAVVPGARGRGVYRSLLAARLEYAAAHGAELALVKGRVETSGPILRRAGFAAYGQERSYLLPPLDSPHEA